MMRRAEPRFYALVVHAPCRCRFDDPLRRESRKRSERATAAYNLFQTHEWLASAAETTKAGRPGFGRRAGDLRVCALGRRSGGLKPGDRYRRVDRSYVARRGRAGRAGQRLGETVGGGSKAGPAVPVWPRDCALLRAGSHGGACRDAMALVLEGDWSDPSRSSAASPATARKIRKAEAQGAVEVETALRPDEVPAMLDRAIAVEARSWCAAGWRFGTTRPRLVFFARSDNAWQQGSVAVCSEIGGRDAATVSAHQRRRFWPTAGPIPGFVSVRPARSGVRLDVHAARAGPP